MGSAEEGIGIGAKLIITVLIASLGLAAFLAARQLITGRSATLGTYITRTNESTYSRYNDADISGYDLWDLMRSQCGVRINGYNFTVEFITGTADVTWSSDKSIGDVVSDNQDDTNYVGEDQTYHCTLVRSEGKTGDVIGVKAQLVQ